MATTHFVEYDRFHRTRQSIAICGDFCDPEDVSAEPTCPECRAELAKTAADVFGTEPPGTPVRYRDFDPTTDRNHS